MEIAQAAFAIFDVRLDQIARLPGAADALFAFGELGGDEFDGGVAHHLVVEARLQFVEQRAVAEQKTRLEDGGADGHVRFRLADAFVDRTRGVADFEPGVPQAIKNGFCDLLAPGGLLVGQHEQQIDIGTGRLQAAAVAAGGDYRHVLGIGGVLRRVEMLAHEIEQDADDLVFQPAQPLGAAAAVAVLEQQLFGFGAALVQRPLQPLRQRGAQFPLPTTVRFGEVVEIRDDGTSVDQICGAAGWMLGRRARAGFEGKGRHGAFG